MARAVPYAADAQGALVDPAEVTGRGPFFCLECKEPVSHRREHLRRGHEVVAHFAHQSGSTCAGESVLHIAAKMRLLEALTLRERPFVIRRVCQRLACEATHDEPWEIPPYDAVGVEVRFGSYLLDVATLKEGAVSVGFEVFVSHRVDTVKAADLNVHWLELQAKATADDPYVLQPVVDSTLTGDEEAQIRRSLRASRAELPEAMERWLAGPPEVEGRSSGRAPPSWLLPKVFESRREGVSFRPAWWCPQCTADLAAHRKAALLAEQKRAALAQERAEQLALAAQHHERQQQEYQRQQLERLAEQRLVFGPWLQKPFHLYALMATERDAPVLRSACRYLYKYWPGVEWRIPRWTGQTLVARRCCKCEAAILCLDARGYLEDFRAFYPMAEYFKPEPGRRGYFISRCLACGQRQRLQDLRRGGHVVLRDNALLSWVDAFGSLARAATPPARQI